jgi:NADP-dependent 3-hydroxy acid dehydrogenase YdfG
MGSNWRLRFCGLLGFCDYSLLTGQVHKIPFVSVCTALCLQILQAFLPSMQEKKHGHIVMLTSVAGLTGFSNRVPLSAVQFAVQGLAESLNEELRNYSPSGDVKLTLVHIYPFIVNNAMSTNVHLR